MNSRVEASADSQNAEKEVASRTVQIQAKRFYLDVKQNRRGRFLKIAEIGPTGQKSRIMMNMSSTVEFREKLNQLLKDIDTADTPAGGVGGSGGDVKLKSEMLVQQNRRYFLDLKENRRGRYLRVVQQVAPSGARSQIAVPAEGVAEVRDRLDELIAECGTEDLADGAEQLPEPKSLRAGNKMLYFDVGFNRRGTYLRLSEVRPNFRTAVTLPEKSWQTLRDIIAEYIDKTAGATAATDAAAAAASGGDEAAAADSSTDDDVNDAAAAAAAAAGDAADESDTDDN